MQTNLVIGVLLLAVVLTVTKKQTVGVLDRTVTAQLKGVAILMVLFAHIGYFLTPDRTFLYPLSVAGGKGVDIFLVLSGFGLTVSALKSTVRVKEFYAKRLTKIYGPMWLVLVVLLVLDAVILRRVYSAPSVVANVLGLFPSADLYKDVNSPLWYFTLILVYYALFPLVFSKRFPLISAGILLVVGRLVLALPLPVTGDVLKLYTLHYMAFPVGMCLAVLLGLNINLPPLPRPDALFVRFGAIIAALMCFGYTAIYSGVGQQPIKEQAISLLAVGCLLVVAFAANYYSRVLTLLGTYSYELYLIHWPLMSRYDFLYARLPAGLATLLYVGVLLVLGLGLKTLIDRLAYGLSPRGTQT
jgi:peptidoglycan/LPS O-acetylase OafA/YrhL